MLPLSLHVSVCGVCQFVACVSMCVACVGMCLVSVCSVCGVCLYIACVTVWRVSMSDV